MTVFMLEAGPTGDVDQQPWRDLDPAMRHEEGSAGYVQLFDGDLADFLGMTAGFDHPGSTFVLHQVYVEPEHRGTGVGKRLMARVVAWADQRRSLLVLAVAPEADCPIDVAAWYMRLGFAWSDLGDGVMFRQPSPSQESIDP